MNIAKYKDDIKELTFCRVCGYKFKMEDMSIKSVKSPVLIPNSNAIWKDWKYYIVCPECDTHIFLKCPGLKKIYTAQKEQANEFGCCLQD